MNGIPTVATQSPVDAVVGFSDRLRAVGIPVSTGETVDALAALRGADLVDRTLVRALLRCTLLKDPAHAAMFDRTFDQVFALPRLMSKPAPASATCGGEPATEPDDAADRLAEALRAGERGEVERLADDAVNRWAGLSENVSTAGHHTQRVLRSLDLDRVLRALLREGRRDDDTDADRRLRASTALAQVEELKQLLAQLVAQGLPEAAAEPPPGNLDDLADRPILARSADELAALRAAVRPLAKRIAARLGRQRRRSSGALDMRRTVRRSMSSGGVPIKPVLRRRSPHRPDLVVLCDVSGSVATFAPFMLSLLHALQDEFARTRSWVFVDGIVEVSHLLRESAGHLDAHQLLRNRGLVTGDGRSDYAAAMSGFLMSWRDAVTSRTTVLVVGDARSHDHPPALDELGEIERLARRVYWLNPEPRDEWDSEDSQIAAYSRRCTGVFEVATLRQLENCVTAIAR